jgi:23S rRNA pseudouridine1911/1915/1917 synthase
MESSVDGSTNTNTNTAMRLRRHGVQIPKDGWYGFSFGFGEKKSISGSYSLYFDFQNNAQEARQEIGIPLPLTHKTKGQQSPSERSPLTSLDAGKLIYLEKGMQALVVQEIVVENNDNNNNNSNNTCSSSEKANSESERPEWKLFALQNQGHTISTMLMEPDNNQQLVMGMGASTTTTTTTTTTSILVSDSHLGCSTCDKLFGTIQGLLCHARHAHPRATTDQDDPMYTTPLTTVFEDDCMAIIVKPQGMTVMGAAPSLWRSNLLMSFKTTSKANDGLSKPVPVHRLDNPTGGLLLVAKTNQAERRLKESFAKRTCHKRYRALVVGTLDPPSGECTQSMGGKEAITRYSVVRYSRSSCCSSSSSSSSHHHHDDDWITVVDLFPVTGRKHQLRKHMKALGHPIWGDPRYNQYHKIMENEDKNDTIHSRLCLWHMEITFSHPGSGQPMTAFMEEPEWLGAVEKENEERWKQSNPRND